MTPYPVLTSKCEALRNMHVRGKPLVLPNAWDAASARAIVAAGYAAVATTSGGVAMSIGYDDHEGAPADEMIAAAARIVRSVDVPVTVDFEAGYGLAADEVAERLLSNGIARVSFGTALHRRTMASFSELIGSIR